MEAPVSRFSSDHSDPPNPSQPPPLPQQPHLPSSSASSPTSPSAEKMKEDAVVKLSQLLAKTEKVGGATELAGNTKNMKQLFSPNVPEQDVVLVLPSLDIQLLLSDNTTNVKGALPGVGETSRLPQSNSNPALDPQPTNTLTPATPQQPQRPAMTASVLTSATKDAANAEHEVAKSLGETTSWTKSTVAYAPSALVNNVSESFSRLVDSRMKAWTLLLLRHSLSTGDESSRKRLLGILSASLKVESVTTQFRTLPLPDSAKGHLKEADVILPLLFEASVTVTGLDEKNMKDNTVTLRAPGTIAADFLPSTVGALGMKNVKVQLDCSSLLSSMVEQARILVLKVVAAATKTHVPTVTTAATLQTQQQQQQQQQQQPFAPYGGQAAPQRHEPQDTSPALAAPKPWISTSKSLAGFRSALNLTPTSADKSPTLKKARASALRLNGILQGKHDDSASPGKGSLGLRKTRSVRWNTPGEIPNLSPPASEGEHSPKKARGPASPAEHKLKSFKSFGRPHAGDFGSGPRNATFGEFGGRSTTGMWGRDGRMAAHPTPMKDATLRDPLSGEFREDKNATFNLAAATAARNQLYSNHNNNTQNNNHNNRPSIHLASGGGGANMPRTATVLESLLMKRSMN